MPKQKSKSSMKKTVAIKMCKSHRILVMTIFSLLFVFMLTAMIYLVALLEFGFGIIFMLFSHIFTSASLIHYNFFRKHMRYSVF